jgi:hypothetical protein
VLLSQEHDVLSAAVNVRSSEQMKLEPMKYDAKSVEESNTINMSTPLSPKITRFNCGGGGMYENRIVVDVSEYSTALDSLRFNSSL